MSKPSRPALARLFTHMCRALDSAPLEVLRAQIAWFGFRSYSKYTREPFGFYTFHDGSRTFLFPPEKPE